MKRPSTLVVLLALLAGIVAMRGPVRQMLATHLMLRSPAPSVDGFSDLAAETDPPIRFLSQAWARGGVVHRQHTLRYLSQNALLQPALLTSAETLLAEAVIDPDLGVRELAMGILPQSGFTWVTTALADQLGDIDPQIRQLGLRPLRQLPAEVALPLAARLLHDPEPQILTMVDSVFRSVTGIDTGLRMRQSITPVDEAGQRRSVSEDQLSSIEAGLELRRAWWRIHASEYPAPALPSKPLPSGLSRGAGPFEFTLPQLDGQPLSISTLRGKVVWISFWATWCTACTREIPILNRLQSTYSKDLVILGISLDGVSGARDHPHEDLPGSNTDLQSSSPAHESATPGVFEEVRKRVDRYRRRAGIQYTLLLDPENRVGAQFNGGELPTQVILDSQGHLRRRFLGDRSLAVCCAMVEDLGCRPRTVE